MNIVQNRKKYFLLSAIMILSGIIFMIFNSASGNGAFNYDVEFSGGTSMLIDIGTEFENYEIASLIRENSDQTNPQIQRIVGTTQVSIKMRSVDDETRIAITDAFKQKYGIKDSDFSIDYFSPTIGTEMQISAFVAVLCACFFMLIYITVRFRGFKTGASTVLALIHDALVVLAAFAILRIPLNYAFIASILTVLGYSINSSIFVFDRIRENRKILKDADEEILINASINQSVVRAINTSVSTLLVIICLFLFGVNSIRDFALPIIIGIICGTYSSIFLAGSFLYILSSKNSTNANQN